MVVCQNWRQERFSSIGQIANSPMEQNEHSGRATGHTELEANFLPNPSISIEKRATGLWPDRMRRNTNRAIMVVAGRVTATARADIGANQSPSKSVGPGLRTDM
jgi:hypothetical protein